MSHHYSIKWPAIKYKTTMQHIHDVVPQSMYMSLQLASVYFNFFFGLRLLE